MAKKSYYCVIDCETTMTDKVFDFAAVICDKNGNVVNKCAVIVAESMQDDLFYDHKNALWSKANAGIKRQKYMDMIIAGTRTIASVSAINRWLEKAVAKYNPAMTAYNVSFDRNKCANTLIDLSIFNSHFCLWHLCCELFAKKKQYKQFALENHYFNNRTAKGNMTIKSNAEVMAHYITGAYAEEPHMSLEDIIDFELPCLVACLKKRAWEQHIGKAYSWNDYVLKDNYKA